MKVLIVGSGGREHAIAWAVSQSAKADKIYCAPGNAGIEEYAECVNIGAMEFDKLVAFAKEKEIDAAKPTEENYNGFAARMQALDELSVNNPILGTAAIFIALSFISLETAPVLVKLIAPKGPYDFLLEKHEHSFKIFSKESIQIMDIKSEKRVKHEFEKA